MYGKRAINHGAQRVNYDVGIQFHAEYLSRPNFDPQLVHRELEIIRYDLGCNAVRISGTDIDRLISTAKDALSQGLEVWLSPHLHDKSPQETLDYTVKCAAAAEKLRQTHANLVFIVGCELTWFMQGILKGDNFAERLGSPLATWWRLKFLKAHNKPLNAYLTTLSKAVREVFHGPITYASAPIEAVDWRLFDFVCLDYYRVNANHETYVERLQRHFTHNKPVIITEVGCCTYQGAEDKGARGFMIIDPTTRDRLDGDYVRDEGLQAREIKDMLGLLKDAGVGGTFVFTFVAPKLPTNDNPRFDLDMASYALVKTFVDKHGNTYPDMPWEPKLAFHTVADFYTKC